LILRGYRYSTLALCAALLLCVGHAPAGANSLDQIQQKRTEINATHERLRAKRAQLDFERLRERDLKQQLAQTLASISIVQAHLSEIGRHIASVTREQQRERILLTLAIAALQREVAGYHRLLVQMYEHPPQTYWTVLVAATSFSDFVERWKDLGYVVSADQRQVQACDAAVAHVNAVRIALASDFAILDGDRRRQVQTQNQLSALMQQRQTLVTYAGEQRQAVASQVENLEEISAQEEAELEQLLREREAELREQEREQHIAPAPPPASGEMMWPVSGPITSPFGMRLNPFGGGNWEFHPGIDIGIPVGTPVLAAATGKVIIAGWVSGYGNYVAIEHGGGISTGYGHLSQIYVEVGQVIARGQVIGASGNTGRSTGPHLIFEVRRNGTPIDPDPFLR